MIPFPPASLMNNKAAMIFGIVVAALMTLWGVLTSMGLLS